MTKQRPDECVLYGSCTYGRGLENKELCAKAAILRIHGTDLPISVTEMQRLATTVKEKMGNLRAIEFAPGFAPVNALTSLVESMKETLRALVIEDHCFLKGDFKDFLFFFRTLGECPQLEELALHFGHMRPKHGYMGPKKRKTAWGCKELMRFAIPVLESRVTSLRKLSLKHYPVELPEPCEQALLRLCTDSSENSNRPRLELYIQGCTGWDWLLPALLGTDSRVVKLESADKHYLPDDGSLPLLALNGVMQHLDLSQVQIPVDKGIELLRSARHDPSLFSLALNLDCHSSPPSWDKLAATVRDLTLVKELSLTINDEPETWDQCNVGARLLLKQLRRNRSLEAVTLKLPVRRNAYCDDRILSELEDEIDDDIGKAAKENALLKTIGIFFGSEWCWGVSPLCRRRPARQIGSETDFWLRYNTITNRHHLESHPYDRDCWLKALVDQRKDTQVVFHLLVTNPSLLQ